MRREIVMRKINIKKGIGLAMTVALVAAVMTGCGSKSAVEISEGEAPTADSPDAGYVQALNEENVSDSDADAKYFKRGVYVNYAAELENPDKTYFYVFDGFGTGHIDDAATNTGKYFEYEEGDGQVKFRFGTENIVEDVFTVKSVENGFVTGSYEGDYELVFEPVTDAGPDDFSAINYINAKLGLDLVYEDPNGWSVKYDPDVISLTAGGPVSTFVYTGECAGTNMLSTLYAVGMTGKEAAEDYAKNWGETAIVHEGIFPGTEDVPGYWVILPPAEEGSGYTSTAIIRDYMDGYLAFEFTNHNSGDDAIDIPASDALAAIVDSLEFKTAG